jgi:hypothetical protein
MVVRDSLFRAYVAENFQLLLVLSTHVFFLTACVVETREFSGTGSAFLSTTHSKLVTMENVHTALRFSEWALEFMIVPPYCFAFVLAAISVVWAGLKQRPFQTRLWKPITG